MTFTFSGKESTCQSRRCDSVPGSGRSPGGGNGNSLQHSCLESSTHCIVRGVAKSQTRLSDFHFHVSPATLPPGLGAHTCDMVRFGGGWGVQAPQKPAGR